MYYSLNDVHDEQLTLGGQCFVHHNVFVRNTLQGVLKYTTSLQNGP